jgi:hypothetical protein
MNQCSNCHKTFQTKSSLTRHVKTAKYCTNSSKPEEFSCDLCCKTFSRKSVLKTHKCVPKTVTYKIFKEAVDMYETLNDENKDLRDENKQLRDHYHKLEIELECIKGKYEVTSEFLKHQSSMVEKLSNKSTYNISTTNINKQINGLEPLTDRMIKDSIEELPLDILSKGGKLIGNWASEGILNGRAVCTDNSRKTFVWKDGEDKPFKDFKGSGLAKKFFTYIHDQKGDELKEWIDNTNDIINTLGKNEEYDGKCEILRMKVKRACMVKSDCHNSANGDSTQLSQDFLKSISVLLTKKDSQEFIEEVVTELLVEEGEIEEA